MTSRCPACELYDMSRGARIRAEIAKTSSGGAARRRFREFMAGVHDRHVAATRERIRALGPLTALMAAIADDLEEDSTGGH